MLSLIQILDFSIAYITQNYYLDQNVWSLLIYILESCVSDCITSENFSIWFPQLYLMMVFWLWESIRFVRHFYLYIKLVDLLKVYAHTSIFRITYYFLYISYTYYNTTNGKTEKCITTRVYIPHYTTICISIHYVSQVCIFIN